jgi:hypothetical protein
MSRCAHDSIGCILLRVSILNKQEEIAVRRS